MKAFSGMIADAAKALGCMSTVEELKGPSRKKRIARERHEVVALLRHAEELSYPDLGLLFNRDHTTMMHSVQQASATRWIGGLSRYQTLREKRLLAAEEGAS